MSGLQIFQFLLSSIHILGLLASVACAGFCVWVWLSGRLESTSSFPYPEFELAGRITTTALCAVWLSALPSAIFTVLEPASYFSIPGMIVLGLFTVFNCTAVGLIHHSRTNAGRRNRLYPFALRVVFSGVVASGLMTLVLFLPSLFLASEIRYLDANTIAAELLAIFFLLYLILFALSLTIQDRWLARHRLHPGGPTESGR